MSGRRAALPAKGFAPRVRSQDSLLIRFVAEDGGAGKTFDFSGFPVGTAMQAAFAAAFAQRTRAGGRLRNLATATGCYSRLSNFAKYLSCLNRPPQRPEELGPAHLQGWHLTLKTLPSAPARLALLKTDLGKMPGISDALAVVLAERAPKVQRPATISYSRAEFERILSTARADVRQAARRIRASRLLLEQWRCGSISQSDDPQRWQQGQLLDFVDQHVDIPRSPSGQRQRPGAVELGTIDDHLTALYLGPDDVAAFIVLLVGVTGENRGSIVNAPAAHHRPDGYTGQPATAIVELDKPRRGANRHMDVPFTGPSTPSPSLAMDEGIDLRSPFGVYTLLHELTARARRQLGTDRLLAWWAGKGSNGRGLRTGIADGNLVAKWARRHELLADPQPPPAGQEPQQLQLTLRRLRLTWAELHQRPVAHTEATLANEYLLRNRGNLADYRKVVADTLEREIIKAKTRSALRVLTPGELHEALTDPATIAARHGLDASTLTRTIEGQLDTVMTACVDNLNSPHTTAGQPCRASFMLCLSCPCARALPHHLPFQIAVHDELQARQADLTPLRWAQRFALPHAQLADLMEQAGAGAVTDARRAITAEHHKVVNQFLHRELDQT